MAADYILEQSGDAVGNGFQRMRLHPPAGPSADRRPQIRIAERPDGSRRQRLGISEGKQQPSHSVFDNLSCPGYVAGN
jgi:hypothetical protein